MCRSMYKNYVTMRTQPRYIVVNYCGTKVKILACMEEAEREKETKIPKNRTVIKNEENPFFNLATPQVCKTELVNVFLTYIMICAPLIFRYIHITILSCSLCHICQGIKRAISFYIYLLNIKLGLILITVKLQTFKFLYFTLAVSFFIQKYICFLIQIKHIQIIYTFIACTRNLV